MKCNIMPFTNAMCWILLLQSDFPSVNLCAYPFILNAQAKTTMLQTDAELQMQVLTRSPIRRRKISSVSTVRWVLSILSISSSPHQDGSQRCKPAQRLHAAHAGTATGSEPLPGAARTQGPLGERHATGTHYVLGRGPQEAAEGEGEHSDSSGPSSHSATNSAASACVSPTQVIFDGEEAVDAGGVTKEFFLLLLKELMDPVYGMFTHYKDSNLLWFSDKVSHPDCSLILFSSHLNLDSIQVVV